MGITNGTNKEQAFYDKLKAAEKYLKMRDHARQVHRDIKAHPVNDVIASFVQDDSRVAAEEHALQILGLIIPEDQLQKEQNKKAEDIWR